MKLKKIASLALAGVMAVSMLAGCSGNGSNGDNNNGGNTVVEPGTSSIVTAFNNGQDEDNKAKVDFTSSSMLDAALKKAVENAGDDTAANTIQWLIYGLTGQGYTEATAGKYVLNDFNTAADVNGEKVTMIEVKSYSSREYWSETAVLEQAAREVDDVIADFKADTKDSTLKEGDPYFAYTYTGNASMVAATQESGATTYYVAYTITRTAAEQKVTKA